MNEIRTSNPNIYYMAPYERLAHLTGASYKTKRQYLWSQGWPHHLYKYKPCNIQHLRSFVVDSLLYLSAHSELNDPFEVQSELRFVGDGPHPASYHKYLFKENRLTLKKTQRNSKATFQPRSDEKHHTKTF